MQEEESEGHSEKALMFMCTNNSTVESAIVKGKSLSEMLFALALEVWQIKMRARARLIILHVLGERMKAQGTSCVSQGQLKEGVSTRKDMLSCTPFHLSSIKRSQAVEPWLCSWLGREAEVLTPEDWFKQGHNILGGIIDSKRFFGDTT